MSIKEALDAEELGLLDAARALRDIRERCKAGIRQEKVSQGEVLSVLERYPNAEIAATKAIVDIYRLVDAMENQGKASAPHTIKIEVVDLEDTRTEQEWEQWHHDLINDPELG